ncbi:MAG: AlpA family phage regulatory protein [Hyphomicrobiales bacterium]|nr:AlpA family phage regulatory protein [Hyphomicrobiales bacterium]
MSNINNPSNDNYDPKSAFEDVADLPPEERLLRWRHVQPRVGICRSYADLLVGQGKFPAPIKLLGGRASAWVESEINAWVKEQIANRKKLR